MTVDPTAAATSFASNGSMCAEHQRRKDSLGSEVCSGLVEGELWERVKELARPRGVGRRSWSGEWIEDSRAESLRHVWLLLI